MNLVQAAGLPFSNVGFPKSWVSFEAKSFKIEAVFEMHRKNADAVVRATYVMLDGLNRMAKRQEELFAAAVGDHVRVAHDVFTHASFGENASNQVGAMRQLYASSVSSLREQSDIAAETNVTVGDILSTRVSEALDEFKLLFGKPGAPTTAGSAANAVVAEPATAVDAAVVAEPVAAVDVAIVAEPAAVVDAAIVTEPAAGVDPAVVTEAAAGIGAAVVAEPAASVDAVVLAKPAAGAGETVVVEPAAGVGEAAAASEAALVEAVPIVGPAAKTRPKKTSPPTKPARRPTSRN